MIRLKEKTLITRFDEYSRYCLEWKDEKGVIHKGFLWDAESDQVKKLMAIFFNGPRGVFTIGKPGSGKTLPMEILRRIIPPEHKRYHQWRTAYELVCEFKVEGMAMFKKYRSGNLIIDDIGREPLGVCYKENCNVIATLMEMRYDAWRYRRGTTSWTSNLSFNTTLPKDDQILKLYGSPFASRMREMCQVFKIGTSKKSIDRREYNNFLGFEPVDHRTEEDLKAIRGIQATYEDMEKNPQPRDKSAPTGLGTLLKNYLNDREAKK